MKFSLDSSGNLKYNKSNSNDEQFLLDENVLIYGKTKDNESSIHLVYLQKNGALNYVLFKDGKIHESLIGNFDTRSNSYNQIEVLWIKNRLNIFYSYSNIINANIYTLHHVIIDEKSQEKYNIIRFASKKREKSFTVSNDTNGIIHLLYNTVSENFSYIYYTYFNPYKGQWLNSPTKLSSSDHFSLYPTILVDSKDNIHSTFWELKDSRYSLKIYRMSQLGKEMYKWFEVQIPPTIEDNLQTRIYEEASNIVIKTNSSKLISKDYGLNYLADNISFEGEQSLKGDIILEQYNPPLGKIEELANAYTNLLKENSLLLDDDQTPLMKSDLELYLDEFKESNNENKLILQQILLNQSEIKHQLQDVMHDLTLLNTSIDTLENVLKNSKSSFRKWFG